MPDKVSATFRANQLPIGVSGNIFLTEVASQI